MFNYCPKCSKKNEGWRFCPDCGCDLENDSSQSGISMSDIAAAAQREADKKREEERRKNMFEIRSGVLVKCKEDFAEIEVPYGVTAIGEDAFNCCKATSITLPSSVTEIRRGAFGNCKQLRRITLPNGLKSIGESAFMFCEKLSSVTLPYALEDIGPSAFDCSGLTSIIIPGSVRTIGDFAFGHCHNLRSVEMNSSAGWSMLREGTFYECTSLTSVRLPDNMSFIDEGVFWNCHSLTSLSIPGACTIKLNSVMPSCRVTRR